MSSAGTSQQAVIDFLGRPATHGGAPVKRIDTHAATVFLAGDRAFKIKRAVRFPFLDYSTLDRRQAACAAEIEVNRPYAPAIYRRAVAITREKDGALAIGGAGEPVEWAVEMRRFDEMQTLDHLAAAGRIDGALADALARAVVRAHAAAPANKAAGFVDELAEVIAQNDAELRAAPEFFPPPSVSALTHATRATFERVRALLMAREHAGLVRRCHGDLHLGNIVLLDGAPVLFDAIEFDPKIATGDVLYDLAFLLMDLIERGLKPAANIVLNRYLSETRRAEDLDALAALPLFLSLRAAIRAKVAAERRAQGAERAVIAQSARAYFALAGRLLAPPPPRLLAVGGLSGTGKSLLARALAAEILPEPGAVVLRSDVERKALFGLAETDRLPQAGLHARRHGPSLRHARRQGAARARRRPFGDRGRGVRRRRRAGGDRAGRAAGRIPRAVPDRRSQRPACPRRRAQRRCLRCRRGGRAPAGAIRSRRRCNGRRSTPPVRRKKRCGAPRRHSALHERKLCMRRPAAPPPSPLACGAKPIASSARSAPAETGSPMNAAPRSTISARQLAVGLTGYCAFVNLYAPQSILPLLSQEFGATAAQVSTIITVSTLAVAVTAPFTGAIADVLGRKRVIVAAMFVLVVPTLMVGLATSLSALIFWRAVQGLVLPPIFAVTVAYIGDEWPPQRSDHGRRHLLVRIEHRRLQRTIDHRLARRPDRLARRLHRARRHRLCRRDRDHISAAA